MELTVFDTDVKKGKGTCPKEFHVETYAVHDIRGPVRPDDAGKNQDEGKDPQ